MTRLLDQGASPRAAKSAPPPLPPAAPPAILLERQLAPGFCLLWGLFFPAGAAYTMCPAASLQWPPPAGDRRRVTRPPPAPPTHPPTHPPLSPARRCSEGLYHCDYCHKDLSSTLRIKCAVCKDFDLCLECFSVGVTLNVAGHASHHAYKVVQSLGFPLYHPGWRVSQ